MTDNIQTPMFEENWKGILAGLGIGAAALLHPHNASAGTSPAKVHATQGSHSIKPLPSEVIRAINMVEAGGRKVNVPTGDHGKALGPFQIHKPYWIDALEYNPTLKTIDGKPATWNDCNNYDYAVKVVNAYMNRYAKKYIGNTLQDTDVMKIALKHNGGGDPNYTAKIKKALARITASK
jgi:hypothetical protein